MQNFTYWNPVKVIFGKGTISELTELVPIDKKVLIIYGGGSIKKNGVYDQVKKALVNHTSCGICWNRAKSTLPNMHESC